MKGIKRFVGLVFIVIGLLNVIYSIMYANGFPELGASIIGTMVWIVVGDHWFYGWVL